jgi:DNA repair exonuclease SbcCD nuclease subunit
MSRITFLHTADWQLGKPFAQVSDPDKRAAIRKARLEVIDRMAEIVAQRKAAFVLVAGDLFDSISVDKATVSAACAAIGRIPVPVFAIPGNHDHGGPGSVWQQPFFQKERAQRAPNLHLLLEPRPEILEQAVILPCPLLHRAVVGDPTAWLQESRVFEELPADRPRIVLAHGSTQRFVGAWADDAEDVSTNLIDAERLESLPVDYVALGDWHGTLHVGAKTWYAGTPEPDRFPRGEDQDPGNVLLVGAARGDEMPRVERIHTARLAWRRMAFQFTDDASLDRFQHELDQEIGSQARETLLRLELAGALGIEAHTALEQVLEAWEARLAWLRCVQDVQVAPTEAEIAALAQRPGDPLIAAVATALLERVAREDDPQTAQLALRLLYAACRQEEEGR